MSEKSIQHLIDRIEIMGVTVMGMKNVDGGDLETINSLYEQLIGLSEALKKHGKGSISQGLLFNRKANEFIDEMNLKIEDFLINPNNYRSGITAEEREDARSILSQRLKFEHLRP